MLREAADTYRAYMLRLWQVQTEQGLAWRASLERVPTGERRAFGSLDGLLAYLREQTTATPPPEGAEEEGR
jgi:hypothetical protein